MASCSAAIDGASAAYGPMCSSWAHRPSAHRMYSRRARPGRSFLLAASAVAAAISSASTGSGCMISACHRQLPRSLPAMVTSPRATAATMLLGRVVHPPQPFQRHDPRRLAGELLQPEVRAVAHAVQRLHRLGELGAAGLTGPGHRHEPELGDIHDVHRTLAYLEQRLVAGRDSGHTIMVATARPTRKEPKVRNQRALGIGDGRRARSRFPPCKARVAHSAATGSSGKTALPSPGGFKARRVLACTLRARKSSWPRCARHGIRGQRAAPIDLGGTVPQTAVILAVTRNFSSTLLNFAAHSPEDTNATGNTVLRAFNRPGRAGTVPVQIGRLS